MASNNDKQRIALSNDNFREYSALVENNYNLNKRLDLEQMQTERKKTKAATYAYKKPKKRKEPD